MARNGNTNVPNLFKKVPKKRIQAPRGRAHRSSRRVDWVAFIDNKKPTGFSAGGFQKSGGFTLRRICTPTAAVAPDQAGQTTPGSHVVRAGNAHIRRLGLRFHIHRTWLLYNGSSHRQRKKT